MTTLERLAEILIVEVDNHALQDKDKSVLWAPSVNHHNSRENVKYIMKLSGTYNESLDWQRRRVRISYCYGPSLINRRKEMEGIGVERTRYSRWEGGDQ